MAALTAKQGGPDDNSAQAGHLIVQPIRQGRAESELGHEGVADTLRAGDGGSSRNQLIAITPTTILGGGVTHSLTGEGHDASEDGTGRGTPIVAVDLYNGAIDGDVTHTLRLGNGGTQSVPSVAGDSAQVGVLYSIMPMNSNTDYKAREVEVAQPLMTAPTGGNQGGDYIVQPLAIRGREGGAELEAGEPGAPYNALRAGDGGSPRQSLIAVNRHAETIVRRLTELECERLQGYPDGWTDGQTASARYRQLGNSVAVPCVEWIARRLIATDKEINQC